MTEEQRIDINQESQNQESQNNPGNLYECTCEISIPYILLIILVIIILYIIATN